MYEAHHLIWSNILQFYVQSLIVTRRAYNDEEKCKRKYHPDVKMLNILKYSRTLNIEPFLVNLFWLNYLVFLFILHCFCRKKNLNNWQDLNDLNFDDRQFCRFVTFLALLFFYTIMCIYVVYNVSNVLSLFNFQSRFNEIYRRRNFMFFIF